MFVNCVMDHMPRYHTGSATQNWFNAALCLFSFCGGNYSVNVAWYCHCKDDFLLYFLMRVKPCAIGKITSFLVEFLHHHRCSIESVEIKKAGRSLSFR